ncbi:MAG: branched-chain amino acid ABC transporter permease [Solirubrobacteraceae bacterium]
MLAVAGISALWGSQFWIGVGLLTVIYGIFTAGLQLNIGVTGIYNFAQSGLMAIGAYSMAILVVSAGWSFWAALPVAAMIAMAAALVVGMPALRLRGDYFAIVTIAASEMIVYVIQNAQSLTGGTVGLIGYNTQWSQLSTSISNAFGLSSQEFLVPLLLVGAVALILTLVVLGTLNRTPWGRVLRAIREDEYAARALGKRVFRYQAQSLAICALLAAVSGYLLALDLASLSPGEFTTDNTFIALAMLLVGGLGTYRGVILGSLIVEFILQATQSINLPLSDAHIGALRFVIVGVALVAFAAWRPQGALGSREEMGLRK